MMLRWPSDARIVKILVATIQRATFLVLRAGECPSVRLVSERDVKVCRIAVSPQHEAMMSKG